MNKITVLFFILLLMSCSIYAQQNANDSSNVKKEPENTKKNEPIVLTNSALFSLGGNLDFVEKTKVTGLYFDINFFKPNILNSRWGVDARLNQGKYIFPADTFSSLTRYYSLDNPTIADSVKLLIQQYNYVREDVPSYITASLSPTYRLFDQEDSPLFLAAQIECIRRKTITNIEYIVTSEAQFVYKKPYTPEQQNQLDRISSVKVNTEKRKISEEVYDFNYALGFKFFENLQNDVTVNIKSLIGYGSRASHKGLFYLTHFEVIETKLGFKIGGEVRGLVAFKKNLLPHEKQHYNPSIAIFFAKTFRFSHIDEIVKL